MAGTAPLPPPASFLPRFLPPFLLACALANTGAVIAYLPLLSLLLPLQVERLAGGGRIDLLSLTVVIGGIVASLSNIAFGWWSDRRVARGGGRRGSIAAGLALLAGSYAALASVSSPAGVIGAVIAVQIAVNAVIAPFLALLADDVPASQKGVAGGLLSLATPLASGLGAVLVGTAWLGEAGRLLVVPVVAGLCFLPLFAWRSRGKAPTDVDIPAPAGGSRPMMADLIVASAARLLVQVAGVALGIYLLYYFESIAGAVSAIDLATRVGTLLTIAYIVPMPFAVLLGRLSDRAGRRKPYLLAAALGAAGGIVVMALARDWTVGAIGFAIHALGATVYLSLHTGFALQLLPDPRHRGRDLGLFNLSNTLPALVAPLLTWWLAAPHDFAPLLLVVAGLTACGGFAMLAVRGRA